MEDLRPDSDIRMANPAAGVAANETPWPRLKLYLTFGYLIRFQLLTLITLIFFPVISLFVFKQLLENLFDLNRVGIFWVTVTSLFAAWMVMLTVRLTLFYCDLRFEISRSRINRHLTWGSVLLYSLLALPVITGICLKTVQSNSGGPVGVMRGLLSVVIGALTAFILLVAADNLYKRINSWQTLEIAPDLLVPSQSLLIRKLSAGAIKKPPFFKPPPEFGQRIQKRIPEYLGRAYIDYQADPAERFPLIAGQGAATAMFTVFLGLYAIAGLISIPGLDALGTLRVPSLALVMLLTAMLCSALSGIAFFFDRYRVPVLVVAGIFLLVTSGLSLHSDSYYTTFPIETKNPNTTTSGNVADLSPENVIRFGNQPKVIVVAANGGGIQSAAWTARVLTGLEEMCNDSSACPRGKFGQSIRLISAVSGGSVGAMYFVDAYGSKWTLDPNKLSRVVEMAEKSSLDGVAWGLVYPDFLRTVLPFAAELPVLRYTDRGKALEDQWRKNGPLTATLVQWRRDVANQDRPGVVFNATVVDTGQPFLLSTVDHISKNNSCLTFDKHCGNYDLPIVTAVRLSASFPFVTPAARAESCGADPKQLQFHIVDGGYYDNYGMVTLVEWLDDALKASTGKITHVLVIRIHSSPTGVGGDPGGYRGWFYQAIAPVLALTNVRSSGQFVHSQTELKLLKEKWEGRGLVIDTAVFEFPNNDAPLSWHLTNQQKDEIANAWKRKIDSPDYLTVKKFLSAAQPQ